MMERNIFENIIAQMCGGSPGSPLLGYRATVK